MIELIDANGQMVALSDNSLLEDNGDAHAVRADFFRGELAAYGLGEDATRLTASGLELRWGRKDETAWVFDAGSRRLYRFPRT